MQRLKRILFNEYAGFSDKRIKNLDKGSTFIVDDRSSEDYGSGGRELFGWFCKIFADVKSDNRLRVTLNGDVPYSPRVEAWFGEHDLEPMHPKDFVAFEVTPETYPMLGGLADAIESIIACGNHYDVKSYKYVCPRTAESLRRLKKTLDRAWPGAVGIE